MSYSNEFSTGDAKKKEAIRDIILRPWQEIVGTCIGMEQDDSLINIVLKVFGEYFRLSIEHNSIRQLHAPLSLKAFSRQAVGRTVSILRTDDSKRPFAIRIVPEDAQ